MSERADKSQLTECEAILKILLEEALPDTVWRFRGKTYETADVVNSKGLLYLLMRQGLETARALRGKGGFEDKVSYIYDDESLTGMRVAFNDDAPCTPFLFFCLDAALYAQALAPGVTANGMPLVDLDVLTVPVPLSPDHFFRPVWDQGPSKYQGAEDAVVRQEVVSDELVDEVPPSAVFGTGGGF